MIKSLQRKEKERKERYKTPRKTQDLIPWSKVYDDGICLIGKRNYTKTFSFSDINYDTADDDEKEKMQVEYGTILNSLDPNAVWKITVMNNRRSPRELENNLLIPDEDDEIKQYRSEVNQMLTDKLSRQNPFELKRYITCSIIKNNIDDARTYFNRLESDLSSTFNRLGSELKPLCETERLKLIHSFFRPEEIDEWRYDGTQRKKFGDCFKNYIAPYSFKPAYDHFQIGNNYGRGLLLTEYPNFLKDTFIKKLTDLKRNIIFSIDINPILKDEAVHFGEEKELSIETEITKFLQRQNQNNNFSMIIPHHYEQERDSVKEFLKDITSRDQNLFMCSATLVHTAPSLAQLYSDTEEILRVAREHSITFDVTKIASRQISCLNTALPYGVELMNSDLRPLITECVAGFVPFLVHEICDENGIYYGTNKVSGNVLKVDPRKLPNGNCWVVGVSGGGKSFSIKALILILRLTSIMAQDTDVIVVDPEREYKYLVKKLGGEIITLSPSSSTHINIFDINADYGGEDDEGNKIDPIGEKSAYILSVIEQILAGEGVSATKKTVCDRAVKELYKELEQCNFKGKMPTMKDFVELLRNMPEAEAKELALQLELYSEGSLNLFAHETNVDTNSSFICYDTYNLGSQLENLGLLVILDSIINRISLNREKGRTTYIIIDEIYLLFKHEYSTDFLERLWRRIRKYHGYAVGIIQDIAELVENPKARHMLYNSEFTIMLRQTGENSEALAHLYHLPDTQVSILESGEPGTGIMKVGNKIVPFENIYPEGTEIYRLMDTKAVKTV